MISHTYYTEAVNYCISLVLIGTLYWVSVLTFSMALKLTAVVEPSQTPAIQMALTG